MNNRDQYQLSILVPVYNEEESIAPFIEAINSKLASIRPHIDIVFVNDGSSDGTMHAINELIKIDDSITLVNLARNFGKEAAMTAGLDYVQGDAVVLMDVDLQDPPELILDFVDTWLKGEHDTVYGIRVDRSKDTWLKRLTAGAFYKVFNILSSDTKLPENVGDFRLIDRKVVNAMRALPERNRFMKGLLAWSSFRSVGVEFERPERTAGETKFNYWKLWNFATSGIVSFTAWPLRIWGFVGVFIAFLGFLTMSYVIIDAFVFGIKTPGYVTTISAILFLGGIQLMSLGIIGNYLSQMYVELKQRPIYLIEGCYGRYSEVEKCENDKRGERED